MLGLAIDSADRIASAALWQSQVQRSRAERAQTAFSLLAAGHLPPDLGESDQLILIVDRLLREQGLRYQDLQVIAVNRGPGSFTGIRSAVALGRGLALATGCPVLGVTSLETLAASLIAVKTPQPLLVAKDARRGEVYVQAFATDGTALGDIEAVSPTAAASKFGGGGWSLAGSGAGPIAKALQAREEGAREVRLLATAPIDATMVAMAAAARLEAGEKPIAGAALNPCYIRAPDASPPAPLIEPAADPEPGRAACSP